jgi:hypothetical protein
VSQGTFEFTGGNAFELVRLNRVLGRLARPASSQEWQSPMTRAELIDLGVFAGGRAPQRQELIERLWSRKRQLLRLAGSFDDWGQQPPVA